MFDLKYISSIKGYSTLQRDAAKMFQAFLKNFMQSWEEARETIEPTSVKLCKGDASGKYLRFDYKIYERREWLHVKSSNCWY